jgi:hypothetical protein
MSRLNGVRSWRFQSFTFVGHIAKPSWCLVVMTKYFCPAVFAALMTASASKSDGLNVVAFASYSTHGMAQLRLIHSASRQIVPSGRRYSPR